jgi:putative aldouronate transport system substrate-binding protein
MKRFLSMMAILLLALPTVIFAQGQEETANQSITLKVLSNVTGGKDSAENALFTQQLEKGIGINIDFEKVPANYNQVLMQKLGAGEPYDLIYLTQDQMYALAKQHAIMDITDMINKSEIYTKNVDKNELEKIAFNGKYYAGFNKLEINPMPNVNKAITDKAGIDISNLSTLDDYEKMLIAVKNYMENTQHIQPYYPMFIYMTNIWDLQPWFSSVGARRGVTFDANGKKYSPYLEENAKKVWVWLGKLYKEGLIDPASFTEKTSDMRSRMWQSQTIVLDSDWLAWTGLYNNNASLAGNYPNKVNIVALPGTKDPEGIYMLEQGNASLWAIPSNAKHPKEAFKLLEYFATPEGGLLLSAGIKGYDYTIEDGKLVFTDIGKTHAKDHGAPFPICKNFDYSQLGKMNPGVEEALAITKQSNVQVKPMLNAKGTLDTNTYLKVMSKWMSDYMLGKISVDAAMSGAKLELQNDGIID